MKHVNMHEAKTQLSKLVEAIESGVEDEVMIQRNGKPAARLVPILAQGHVIKLGVADGLFTVPDDFDRDNDDIATMFYGKGWGEERCD